jgi:archaellum component FlaC
MANSFVRYTGNGTTTTYAIPFSYRSADDLTATVAGVNITAYTLDAAGTNLTFTTAPANGAAIEIRRTTSQSTKLVDYVSGAVLTENDLDTDSDQAFYMSQEAIDKAGDVITLDNVDFNWDIQNKRLKNVADPVDNTDAVNKQFISTNIPNITTVAGISSDVTTVAGISSDVTAVANDATDIGTVASNIADVSTVATNISDVVTVANDLNEAISEIETAANDLNEATSEIDTVSNNIANVNTVGNNITNVNTVAANDANITTVAGIDTDVTSVAGVASSVPTVAGISANVTTVAGVSSDVTTVAGISSDVSTVSSNNANVTSVAGAITNVNNVGNNITNVNTVASNISGVNSFADRYRISASAPTTSLDVGDLYFDTNADELKVYKSSGWAAAGSTINGTSARFTYTISGTPTTVSGVDDNGETLAYDAGFADVYVNGVRMSSADITITSGTSVVFASALTNGDVVDVVAYGTFDVASIDGSNITSGTISNSRLTGNGAITINGSAVSLGGSVTIGETKPTVASVSPSTITNAQTSVTITGTNFLTGASVEAVGTDGSIIVADTVSFTNSTTLVANFTIPTDSTYFIRVENTDGNAARSSTAILTVSDAPTWTTSAGSLGSIAAGDTVSLSVAATSDSTVAYSETTSVLTSNANTPAGTMNLSLNSSTGAITGTAPSPTSETTYNFTLRATDDESQTADRAFSITVTVGINNGGQFN